MSLPRPSFRRLAGIALLGGFASTAAAQTRPQPAGYAFDQPRILTQQIIWGIAHGARLLAEACQRRGDAAAGTAYTAWQETQGMRVAAAARDLARYYFGRDVAGAAELDAALKLSPALKLSDSELGPACETLGEALRKPRYDLEKYYAARREAIRKGDPMFPGAVWDETDALGAGLPARGGDDATSPSPEPNPDAAAPAASPAENGNPDDARSADPAHGGIPVSPAP